MRHRSPRWPTRYIPRSGVQAWRGWSTTRGPLFPDPSNTSRCRIFVGNSEVNLVGPLAVTQALLPLLRTGHGRVVNVTSAAGKAGVPLMAPYVAAKHGLEGLSDVLRLEFRQLGVHVSVVEPGFIATAMGGKLQRDTEDAIRSLPGEGRRRYGSQLEAVAESISEHAASGSGPEVVANAVMHALTSDKPRTRYPVGEGAKRMLLLRRILPDRRFDRIILKAGGLD